MELRRRIAAIPRTPGGLGRAVARLVVETQLRAGVAAIDLAARALQQQIDHDDARVRVAARAARAYLKRRRRRLATGAAR
jgi:hypothetical protein